MSFIPSKLQGRPRPIALAASPLGQLPRELLIYITKFLPTASTALFALSCKTIYFLLLPRCSSTWKAWTSSSPGGAEFERFLGVLERDLPKYIACHYCNRLHTIAKAHPYYPLNLSFKYTPLTESKSAQETSTKPLCRIVDSNLGTHIYLNRCFCFPTFQMAIKLHRQGGNPTKLLKELNHKPLYRGLMKNPWGPFPSKTERHIELLAIPYFSKL